MIDFRKLSRKTPLRWLILGYYLLILTLTLGILSCLIYSLVSRFLWASNESRLRTTVQTGWFFETEEDEPAGRHPNWRAGLPAPPGYPLQAEELARRMSGRWMYVRILEPDGAVVAENGRTNSPPPVDVARLDAMRDLVAADEPRRGRNAYLAVTPHGNWQVLLFPIMRGERLVGFVQIAGAYRPAQELLQALGGYLVLGGIGALLLATVITLGVSRFLAYPMRRVIAATRRVRAGDLSARTGLPEGTNEMYAVAFAFDKMVEQLQDTFNAQRRFVADASHELKTPLTAIGGMTELLRMGADKGQPAQRDKALATIEKEVDRMAALVADLLTLSRAEQAALPPSEDFDLTALLGETLEHARVVWPDHKFETRFEGPIRVLGERDELSRAFGNLLDNAAKYSCTGSTVFLSAGVAEGWARVEVRDQGVGISATDLPRIFERFYRADASRARKTGGSGLGLAIVRALLEQHGGRVSCESVPGEGSTFTVLLPLVKR